MGESERKREREKRDPFSTHGRDEHLTFLTDSKQSTTPSDNICVMSKHMYNAIGAINKARV